MDHHAADAARKAALRRSVEARRSALSPAERSERSLALCRRVLCDAKLAQPRLRACAASRMDARPAGGAAARERGTALRAPGASGALPPRPGQADLRLVMLAYVPFRDEADITPLLEACWLAGGTVVVPKVQRHDRSLRLQIIEGWEDLEAGAWGIREPKPEAVEWTDLAAIDLVLVPGLAFDLQGGRLGYGAGFYDRFMARFDRAGFPQPWKLALAYDLQIVNGIPMEPHDLRVDQIVTECGNWLTGIPLQSS